MILDYTIITHVAVVPLLSLVPDFIFLEKKNPKKKKNPDVNCNFKLK